MAEEKVNKKKQKALAFRKSKEEREKDKAEKAEAKAEAKTEVSASNEKKRLADDESPAANGDEPAELVSHFKNANPDRIRIRKEKGIAFLEFDNEGQEVRSKMDHALGMHHSTIRKRKINVELTVGGGGNLDNRQKKLKEKNDKLEEERKTKKKKEEGNKKEEAPVGGMHPARAALLKNRSICITRNERDTKMLP
ncbi:CIC11C00000001682 [Sungouiella intermedia]|uniref:CIC11C00000001682 n=1 Tax=Sungouiella intermedia TaxID=45354 RepID=A0A1L0DQB4_9ASCO|nr:CIC11C00000001682 [[Candida] intermedia]